MSALFLIVTRFFSSQISKLNFDYWWCFSMIYYPTFLIHQNLRIDLRYSWVLFNMKRLVEIIWKIMGGEETLFFFKDFATQMKSYSVCPNMKLAHKWGMICFPKLARTHLFISHCEKITYAFKGQDYSTSFSRWSKWNGGVIIVSHLFQNYKLITDKLSYRNFWLTAFLSVWRAKKNLHKFPKIIKYGIYSLNIHFCFYKTSSLSESTH